EKLSNTFRKARPMFLECLLVYLGVFLDLVSPLYVISAGIVDAVPSSWWFPVTWANPSLPSTAGDEIAKAVKKNVVMAKNFVLVSRPRAVAENVSGFGTNSGCDRVILCRCHRHSPR